MLQCKITQTKSTYSSSCISPSFSVSDAHGWATGHHSSSLDETVAAPWGRCLKRSAQVQYNYNTTAIQEFFLVLQLYCACVDCCNTTKFSCYVIVVVS